MKTEQRALVAVGRAYLKWVNVRDSIDWKTKDHETFMLDSRCERVAYDALAAAAALARGDLKFERIH